MDILLLRFGLSLAIVFIDVEVPSHFLRKGGSAVRGVPLCLVGGQETKTEIVTRVRFVADENVVTEKPKHPRKKRQAVTDASGSSHPPKKLRGATELLVGPLLMYINSSGDEAYSVIRFVVVPLDDDRGLWLPPRMWLIFSIKAVTAGPSYFAKHLSIGSRGLNFKTLHQVFVLQWNVLNDSLLDDYDVSYEFVDHLASLALFSQIREMDYHHLFTEFNVRTARQACLNAEVKGSSTAKGEAAEATRLRVLVAAAEATEKMNVDEIDALKHRNVVLKNKKESLDGKVAELQSSVSTKDLELKDLNVVVLFFSVQEGQSCGSGYERLKEQIEEFQDVQMNIVNDKVASGHNLCFGMRAAANLSAFEKEDPRGGIPFTCRTKISQRCNPLRLEGPLVDAPGMSDLQPDVEQLTLPIHRLKDQVVLGETSLSFALSVTHSRVERIRENVAAQWSALIDVWVPLVNPLSAKSLISEASTSGSVLVVVVTTTAQALFDLFAAARFVPPNFFPHTII
ncbi:hypothetical protein Tco_0778861 [Tanacetum coccineum]